MRSITKSILFGAIALAVPAAVVAQEQGEAEVDPLVPPVEVCTVTLEPAELPAGEEAVHVMGTLSGDFGPVTGFEAPEESGLVIAEADDIPFDEMANEVVEEVEKVEVEVEEDEVEVEAEVETEELVHAPIEPGAEANTFAAWLSTEKSLAGAFNVRFTTATGACDATVTVVAAGETEDN